LRTLGAPLSFSQSVDPDWCEHVLVESMSDGGMGSLRLHVEGRERGTRANAGERSVVVFKDIDRMEVWATIYVDSNGIPFELDVWKVDFSPLQRIPDVLPAARLE
jgi:hypothetical protein